MPQENATNSEQASSLISDFLIKSLGSITSQILGQKISENEFDKVAKEIGKMNAERIEDIKNEMSTDDSDDIEVGAPNKETRQKIGKKERQLAKSLASPNTIKQSRTQETAISAKNQKPKMPDIKEKDIKDKSDDKLKFFSENQKPNAQKSNAQKDNIPNRLEKKEMDANKNRQQQNRREQNKSQNPNISEMKAGSRGIGSIGGANKSFQKKLNPNEQINTAQLLNKNRSLDRAQQATDIDDQEDIDDERENNDSENNENDEQNELASEMTQAQMHAGAFDKLIKKRSLNRKHKRRLSIIVTPIGMGMIKGAKMITRLIVTIPVAIALAVAGGMGVFIGTALLKLPNRPKKSKAPKNAPKEIKNNRIKKWFLNETKKLSGKQLVKDNFDYKIEQKVESISKQFLGNCSALICALIGIILTIILIYAVILAACNSNSIVKTVCDYVGIEEFK